MDSSRETSPTSSPSNPAVKLPTIIVTDTSREDAVKSLLARTSWLSFDQQFDVLEKFAKLEALLQLFGEDSWISRRLLETPLVLSPPKCGMKRTTPSYSITQVLETCVPGGTSADSPNLKARTSLAVLDATANPIA